MPAQILPTVPEPEIYIEAGGDLRLAGADVNEIRIEAGADAVLNADPAGAQVRVTAPGDLTLSVPRQARVRIQRVGGDARPIKDLAGPLVIGDVGGALMLRRLAAVEAGHIGGDVSAKEINGDLRLAGAGGDVSVRGVAGAFDGGFAGGDLYVRDVQGAAQGQAGGDVRLNLAFAAGQTYSFRANGDLTCRVPAEASARLTITCTGELVVDVAGARTENAETEPVVILGAGAATVQLRSNGDVSVADLARSGPAGGEDFGETVAAQVESQVAAKLAEVERDLNAQFGEINLDLSGWSRVNAQEIAARAQRAAEAARRKSELAQRKVEAAQRKAERAAERASRPRRSWGFTFGAPAGPRPPVPPVPPAPPRTSEPISDEERLTILRLLEQGKISAAEAEKLLSALEGKA